MIERLSDALQWYGKFICEGLCETSPTEKEPEPFLSEPSEGEEVPGVRFWQRNSTTTLSRINILLVRLEAYSFFSRVVWAESRGIFRHDLFQAVSPWFVQGVCATEALNHLWERQ